jgi:hypothetical protein
MDQVPEKRESIVQSWVGTWVELHYAASSAEVTPHGEISGPAETRIGACRLEAVDEKGTEASLPDAGKRSTLFIPWHSVLLIQGPSRQEMEQDQSEQTAEASRARRQELMDLLASAETQPKWRSQGLLLIAGWLLTLAMATYARPVTNYQTYSQVIR